jgi:cyclopropane-fatty-acyl-phospholipid synthase
MRGALVEADGYVGAGPASIGFHYDQGNEFFALWLDSTMTYTAALWDGPGDDLRTAQLRKLDYVAGEARASGARSVLDLGSGWGGMLRRLVDVHGVQRALGITLSEAQVAYAEADREGDPRIETQLQDWRTLEPEAPFDAIVSVGAVEHFAALGAPAEERAAIYRELFERCRGWLPRGGRLVIETMAQGQVPLDRRGSRDLRHALTKLYPNTGPPELRELVIGCAGLFEILRLRNDRLDYAATQMAWRRNLRANRERAVELVGEETVDNQERCFAGLARHFALGQAELLRLTLAAI